MSSQSSSKTPHPSTPETFTLPATPHVPNSHLPVVIYRNVLTDTSPSAILSTIEPNGWLKGGQWHASVATHFHSTTHECYGIVRGSATYVLGSSEADAGVDGGSGVAGYQPREIRVARGDVFVLPAGVSHTSKDHADGYEFIGLYPEGGERTDGNPYDMNWCDETVERTEEIKERARRVPVPVRDPVFGVDGPLVKLWREARAVFEA